MVPVLRLEQSRYSTEGVVTSVLIFSSNRKKFPLSVKKLLTENELHDQFIVT